jgi:MauM/NapG family ferredoxin protein
MLTSRREFFQNLAGVGAAATGAVLTTGTWETTSGTSSLPLRPPGALPESEFLNTCIRCMRCVDACPNLAIKSLPPAVGCKAAGTPHIKPREQACMLCSRSEGDYLRCTEVCPSGALRPVLKTIEDVRQHVHMGIAKIDLNLCYSYNNYTCGTCFHACPVGAIKIGLWERPSVVEQACIGCGLCERACIRYPQAIRVQPVGQIAQPLSPLGDNQ